MYKGRKEDIKLYVNIQSAKDISEKILCEIYLPERCTDEIIFLLLPDKSQFAKCSSFFKFSIKGEIKNHSGKLIKEIVANEVYSKHTNTKHWSSDIVDINWIVNPLDFTIITHLNEAATDIEKVSSNGSFWLSPSRILNPAKDVCRSHTGDIAIKTTRQFKFNLLQDVELTFDSRFKHIENSDGDTISFNELIANFEFDRNNSTIEIISEYLDDFLMLTSLATRSRCICVGWNLVDPKKYIEYFRREYVIPKKQMIISTIISLIS